MKAHEIKPGDEFECVWNDGQVARYKVVERIDDHCIRAHRWIQHRKRWTEWTADVPMRWFRRWLKT